MDLFADAPRLDTSAGLGIVIWGDSTVDKVEGEGATRTGRRHSRSGRGPRFHEESVRVVGLYGPSAPPFPRVLPPHATPSAEHVQAMWAKVKQPRERLPDLELCRGFAWELNISPAYELGRPRERRPPTPIADALETLRAVVPPAVAYWREFMEKHPTLPNPPEIMRDIEKLYQALSALTPMCLREVDESLPLHWQSYAWHLQSKAERMWVKSGNKTGKPHSKNRICLFLFEVLTAIRLGKENLARGGCKSPGAVSEYLRKQLWLRGLLGASSS